MALRRVDVLGSLFDAVTLESAAEWILAAMREGRRAQVCTVNVAISMMARRDPELDQIIRGADLVVADGQPIVWASSLLGDPLPERVGGVDLVDQILGQAAAEGLPVYFLGARREIVEEARARAETRHGGLRVEVADGYFGPEQAAHCAERVAASGARLLLCGMGVPKQEYFLRDQKERLGPLVGMGVGGTFEVMAGVRRRAPEWAQRAGMEWAIRLAQEPRRLWRRYLETNSEFLYLLGRELAQRTRGRR